MCVISLECKSIGKFVEIRVERNLFYYLTVYRLIRRIAKEKMNIEVWDCELIYTKDDKEYQLVTESWDDFESSVVIKKQDNTKWGSFHILINLPNKKQNETKTESNDDKTECIKERDETKNEKSKQDEEISEET